MKFLCDNCKAKYQIADEKVAGKTVRMKCRKCGHQIEVRAAVTETSVSTSLPQVGPGANPSAAEHAPRAPVKSSLATSLSAQKPRAPMQSAPQASALAASFQQNVAASPSMHPAASGGGGGLVELSVTDEWYVAINGVPVGPVRISELRRKAGSGAVTEESLCWQEGLEEWRPVRSIPELAALVREAAQGNRPSLISPAPSEGRTSSPPRPPARPAPPAPMRSPEPPRVGGGGETVPMAPARPLAPPAPGLPGRSNVVPLRVAASNASNDDAPPITAPLGGAAAALAPSFTPSPSPFAPPTPAPLAVSDPFAVPPAPMAAMVAPAPADLRASSSSMLPAAPFAPSMVPQAPARRGVPLWFWPILVFTGVFGVAAAVFVFRQQAPAPVVIQMPATAAPTTSAPEAKNDVPPPPPSGEPAPTATASSGTKVGTGPAKGATAAAATTEKKGIDLGGLVPGSGGPNVGAGGGPSPNGGGGLDSTSVERVVAGHRAGVKRTCWERGGADQKASVNVTVSATVGPDGHVQSTSSSGDDPVVGKCIETQVRGWVFAAPGSATTVNIPFKFVRQ